MTFPYELAQAMLLEAYRASWINRMNLIIELEASENMDSLRISEIFHEMAFSELLEESPFKSRAYERPPG